MWVFDMGGKDEGRLLRSQIGHKYPPTRVQWLNNAIVMTAGDRTLRFSFLFILQLLLNNALISGISK